MDLEKLKHDWANDPTLKHAAYDRVEQLAVDLVKAHKFMMSPDAMLVGYLYQAQVKRVRDLTRELENERRK